MRRLRFAEVALIASLVAGAALRFWHLTDHSLFIDEGFTLMVAGKPWPQMMQWIVYHDFHPPLFYAMGHAAIALLHWRLWDYRYLTAPLGLVTIAASWAIARRLFGDVAAAVAAIVVALDPSLIEWDRMFRMYGLMTALAATSWWLLLIAQEKKGAARWWAWTAYALTAVVQPYIQYLGALDVLCQSLYAGAAILADRRRAGTLWPAFVSAALSVAALLPWSWAIRVQYPNGGLVAGTTALPIYWWGIARDSMLTGVPLHWALHPWFDPAVTIAAVGLGVYAAIRAPRTVLPWWFAVAAIQVLLSVAAHKSLVVPRYMEHVVPAAAIAIGALVGDLAKTRVRVAALAVGIAVPAALAACTADLLWDPYYQQTDWYLVNLVVLQHEKPADAMLFDQGFPYVVVGDFTAFRGHPAAGPAMPSDLPYTFHWIDRHARDRIWYIENQYFYPDPKKRIKAYLDARRPDLGTWSESKALSGDVVNIVLYGPASKNLGRGGVHSRTVVRSR